MDAEKIEILPSWRTKININGFEHRSALDFRLTEKDYEKALQDLGETDLAREQSLKILRERLQRDADLNSRTDDGFLLRFLRFCKFDGDKAYDVIRKFYVARLKTPFIFSLPSKLQMLLDQNYVRWLPYRTEEGCILALVDYRNWIPEIMSVADILVVSNVMCDVITMNPSAQVHGIVDVWDMSGFSAQHAALTLMPKNLLLLSAIVQSLHPWRVHKIILFNCNAFARTIYGSISWLLKKKIKDRIVLLGSDLSQLHQHVPPQLLPTTLGGTLEDSQCNMTEVIMKNLPYLKYDRGFGIVSKKASS